MAKSPLTLTKEQEQIIRNQISSGGYLTQEEAKLILLELDKARELVSLFRKSEAKLSQAYLRIRNLLDAWETPPGPTQEQIFLHTEQKLHDLINKQKQDLDEPEKDS